MSAYIVEPETIQRIVTHLYNLDSRSYVLRRISQECSIDVLDSPATLAQAMLALNVEAVDQRYNEKNPFNVDHFSFVLSNRFQALKSLRCWIYQCSEGNVPERSLYKILDDYAGELAYSIVQEMPQYENAQWA